MSNADHTVVNFYLRVFEADAMLRSNLNIPLKGVAIGNGWIDVRRQYPSYLDYSVKYGLLEENSPVSSHALLLRVI